mmetsp:Transcript_26962/g.72697  ORF Transcript_26962/g.72697 Transcript_26962/m.72697 type:complete len:278 (-) Transcript_26962:978-1811(-)
MWPWGRSEQMRCAPRKLCHPLRHSQRCRRPAARARQLSSPETKVVIIYGGDTVGGDSHSLTESDRIVYCRLRLVFLNVGCHPQSSSLMGNIAFGLDKHANLQKLHVKASHEIQQILTRGYVARDGKRLLVGILFNGDVPFLAGFFACHEQTHTFGCPWCRRSMKLERVIELNLDRCQTSRETCTQLERSRVIYTPEMHLRDGHHAALPYAATKKKGKYDRMPAKKQKLPLRAQTSTSASISATSRLPSTRACHADTSGRSPRHPRDWTLPQSSGTRV